MSEKETNELAIELTLDIEELCNNIKGNKMFKDELMQASSSIGLYIHEAKYSRFHGELIKKLESAIESCNDTEYWSGLLFKSFAINEKQHDEIVARCTAIRKRIVEKVTTTNKNIYTI